MSASSRAKPSSRALLCRGNRPTTSDHIIGVEVHDDGCDVSDRSVAASLQDVVRLGITSTASIATSLSLSDPDFAAKPGHFTNVPPRSQSTLSSLAATPGTWVIACHFETLLDGEMVGIVEVSAPEPTASIEVVFDGSTCDTATDRPLSVGDSATVEFLNQSDARVVMALHRLPAGIGGVDSVFESSRAELASTALDPSETAETLAVFPQPMAWAAVCRVPSAFEAVDSPVLHIAT